jgi:arabinogalactan endo-1,4-beta-galactosidase
MRLVLVVFLMACLPVVPTMGATNGFLKGADASFLPQVEDGGGVFLSGGEPTDLLTILHSRGINTLRLRLWHTPDDGHNGLVETLDLAERAQDAGFGILLDIHYSDTWADPSHQAKPGAWSSLSATTLGDSVRAYTRDVMTAFAHRGLAPAIVQIGNEITLGLLWDEGRVGNNFDTPDQWENLASLIQAAIEGVHDALPAEQRPGIMIHIDRGGDNATARRFFDHLLAEGVDFDLIGLSYYPWWHGSLEAFQANLNDLAIRYEKNLVVVETAYPWTLGWFDHTHNIVGLSGQLLPGYPATPEGQRAFFTKVLEIVHSIPGNRGRGVFWWAPEWISSEGFGSSWENLALFDDEGNPLPILLD